MLTKIRFFMKGVRFTTDIFFIFLVWALVEKNVRVKNELEQLKNDRSLDSKTPCKNYKMSHHPKGRPVKIDIPKNPIGFAYEYSNNSEESCD